MTATPAGSPLLQVLTLTPFYPHQGDDAGGCFVAEPLQWMSKSEVRNTVIAVQPLYRATSQAADSDFPVNWLRYFSLPGGFGLPTAGAFLFARIIGLIRELQRTQPISLIHAHAPLPCGHAAMLLQAELAIPYVVSVHGLDAFSTEQVSGRSGQWCRSISERVYRSAKRVICVSEHVREQVLAGTGPTCRTSVVYNGVDPERFSPAKEPRVGAQVILSVGNLIPIKGHDVLIKAVAMLTQDFPSLELEIIGEGSERSRLEGLAAQLNIADRVRFVGRKSRSEVAAAMQRCTVFALPSRYEALGCVYLEAMAAGKPTVGCRGQGIAEVIRHGSNGFLVGPDNDRELALALTLLLRDEARRQSMSIAARDTILDRFTLAEQAATLTRIYRESAG